MAIDERAARDPFIRQFFERIPAELRGTFTSPQLAALKMIFGESTGAGHAVDIRLEAPLPLAKKKRLYMVVLSGPDHRGGKRIDKLGFFGFAIRKHLSKGFALRFWLACKSRVIAI